MKKLIKVLFSISDVISTGFCGFLLVAACIIPFALNAQAKMQGVEVNILDIAGTSLVTLGYSLAFYLISKRDLKGFLVLISLSIIQSMVIGDIISLYIYGGVGVVLFAPFALALRSGGTLTR